MTEKSELSISEALRRGREARGESLEQVQQRLGVSLKILQGIEAGQYDVVEPIYARLAIWHYAEHVGLGGDAMAARFVHEIGLPEEPVVMNTDRSAPVPVDASTSWIAFLQRQPLSRIVGAVILLVILVIVAIVLTRGEAPDQTFEQSDDYLSSPLAASVTSDPPASESAVSNPAVSSLPVAEKPASNPPASSPPGPNPVTSGLVNAVGAEPQPESNRPAPASVTGVDDSMQAAALPPDAIAQSVQSRTEDLVASPQNQESAPTDVAPADQDDAVNANTVNAGAVRADAMSADTVNAVAASADAMSADAVNPVAVNADTLNAIAASTMSDEPMDSQPTPSNQSVDAPPSDVPPSSAQRPEGEPLLGDDGNVPDLPPVTTDLPGAIVLEARALDSTWVQVQWDGVDGIEEIIPKGEVRRWQADRFFMVRAGRAHGVHFRLQGALLGEGRLGDATKVLRFQGVNNGYQMLGPELEPLGAFTPLPSLEPAAESVVTEQP